MDQQTEKEIELKTIDQPDIKVESNVDNSTYNDIASPTAEKTIETTKKVSTKEEEPAEVDGTLNSTQV